MDILFEDPKLERLCSEAKAARRELGEAVAKTLQKRLTQLRAASNLQEMPFGKPHPLKGDLAGCFGIWLDGGFRLVVRPKNDPLPLLPDGGLDRARVTVVAVVYVGNYHD